MVRFEENVERLLKEVYMKRISVIVPVYNAEQYLLRCIDSIQKQTYKNLEIILVDDGSPDGCGQICDDLMASDPRIRVFHKENGGQGFARNTGLDAATGEYVTFVDSDDWISENHIENLYQAAAENQADAVIGSCTRAWASGGESRIPGKLIEGCYEGEQILNKILLPIIGTDEDFPGEIQMEASNCMNLYRLPLIQEAGLRFISERYAVAEDYFFNVEFFCKAKRVYALNEFGYYYFENRNSTSNKYDENRFARTLNFYKQIQETVVKYGIEGNVDFRIRKTFLMKVRVAIRNIVLADMPRKCKLAEIRTILRNDTVAQVLKVHPAGSYGIALRVLTVLMRCRNALGVYFLMLLREKIGRKSGMQETLKRLGLHT